MQYRTVPDRDFAAQDRREGIVRYMDHGHVLYIGSLTNSDRIHIAPNNRPKPHAGIASEHHISNNAGVRRDENRCIYSRCRRPEGQNQ
jgi:hypothetical protein